MTVPNLTPKQMKILQIVHQSRITRGFSPTMQEMAEQLGVSKVTVFEHVQTLIKKGCLIRDKNKARSLEVHPDLQLPDETRSTRLPLVGTIAAGVPIEAVEQREHLDLEDLFSPRRGGSDDLFVLKVRGDSMIDEQIREGDYVICRRTERGNNGQTVVALVDGEEATLKKFYREKNGTIRLQPANDAYEPIWVEPDRLQVQGHVVGVVRTYG